MIKENYNNNIKEEAKDSQEWTPKHRENLSFRMANLPMRK
jgi:hypothetical protein